MRTSDEPLSLPVTYTIVGKYFVSTALWRTLIMAANGYVDTFETFIWEYNAKTNERGELVKQYYHNHFRGAVQFHQRFTRTLIHRTYKQLYKERIK